MRKFLILTVVAGCILTGCLSTEAVQLSPSEIEYKEISGAEYCASSYDALFKASKGYKVTDVYIESVTTVTEDGKKELILRITGVASGGYTARVYAGDFAASMNESAPDLADRIESVRKNQKYNGKYTFYIYRETTGNIWDGYKTRAIAYNIEGIPSQEQLDADIAAAEAERLAIEEAEKKAREEKIAAINRKCRKLAEGYVYHGVEEDVENRRLFDNGALQPGHAYYISYYRSYHGGSYGKSGLLGNLIYVHFISQQVKGQVTGTGDFVSVLVVGGKAPSYIPVIIALVE